MSIGDYDDFYGHYEPFITSFVTRRAATDDAADLVAEVFAIAWRRRADVPTNALPWLYRTARNVVGNRYRSDARLAALQAKIRAIPVESPADPAEVAGDRDRLVGAFGELSDDDRELLLLVAWEGLTTHDIAEVMHISPGAASVRVHRARRRLDQAMRSDDMKARGER